MIPFILQMAEGPGFPSIPSKPVIELGYEKCICSFLYSM